MRTRLAIGPDENGRWEHLSRRLTVPFHDGIISQFAGYEALVELDWSRYRRTYANIGRLDLILEAEGDSTNRYRLAKQADVLMLPYLLGIDGLEASLNRLGYPLGPEVLARTIEYYLARTAHGSTLSRVVHASVLARADPTRAWQTFRDALASDLDDTQGGTTGEGIHLGAMAGTIDIVTRVFAGLRTEGDTLIIDPRLPHDLRSARFTLVHRGEHMRIALTHDAVTVSTDPCVADPRVRVRVNGRSPTAHGGQMVVWSETPLAVPDARAVPGIARTGAGDIR